MTDWVFDAPPINILQLLQSNMLQSFVAVAISAVIGMAQKTWGNRAIYGIVSFPFTFYVIGNLLPLVQAMNYNLLATFALSLVGTWIVAKEQATVKK